MCKFCDYNSPENRVFVDGISGDWYYDEPTAEYDPVENEFSYDRVFVDECPWCGRKLARCEKKK